MSVIIGRALPDARDGLKPVHRRILYAMNELNLSSRAAYKKSARIVGDVIGKYHPHGDNAVYDALVRMAQPFSMRVPLIDGQGNFGSIDGDNAAAMRYTEARMTPLSEELLKDLDKDTVDFIPNYDERDESDRDGIRVVIELKRDAMSEIILNNLYKSSSLEVTFGIIILAIENKEPKVFNLLELLQLFLKHRKTVLIRRTIYELEKAKARAHILEGLKIALDNIDEIITLIKKSEDAKTAKIALMENFSLSEIQAGAILDMKLQRLTGLEREKIENELQALLKEIQRLSAILKSEELLNKLIKDELMEVKEKFSSKRLTEIIEDYADTI